MSRVISTRRSANDHFESDDEVDPKVQRQLRGHLEQIDYAAYTANRKILSATLSSVDADTFQRLSSAAAIARTRWVVAALAVTEKDAHPSPAQIRALTDLRTTYEELADAYDGLRRMVERGYITFEATPAS